MFETLLLLKANALCGLNPALLGGFPQLSNPPSTSPLLCSEDHHLPFPDCEFSLIKHQTASPNEQ